MRAITSLRRLESACIAEKKKQQMALPVQSVLWTEESNVRNGEKDKMEANKYQVLAARTINKKLMDKQQLHHSLHGMSGEVGEIHSIFQKAYQGHVIDEEHLKKEVGDLLWFIAEFCTANCWDLSEIMEMNIEKLKARFPEGFKEENSLNRKLGDI